MSRLWDFVLLVALLLMPFGMQPASAADHFPSMSIGHCPDQGSKPDSKGTLAHCTMACSAALPAVDAEPIRSHEMARTSFAPGLASALSDIELEIATPPPRLS
jgi:hypothetical protein